MTDAVMGRSSQPWNDNEMDTFADDLSELIEALDLKDAALIGFSMGGGKVARYIGHHGTKRVTKAALIAVVPQLMLKTAANPGGLPIVVFDGIRLSTLADRSLQFYKDLASGPFFGANRHGAEVSQGMIDSIWLQGMQAGHKNTCYKSVADELKEAGALYEDRDLVVDANLIPSQQPADLPAFMREIMKQLRL